ncbi:glycosyltransferase family protein [Roseivirga sp. UBA1976]|uniref:glycosyltransferase family protein n=1 Tax=Roseivirga sp. UBA1976 TaxID=1947386 RepID=UPI00257F043D|nr:glycosyltransferase family protein [Roseivirga sp. UBA1976]MEC7754196.1 glycosyltransferase family protein [Bacteroidota bacterium]|tara:strand:+ start:3501 stop:4643 length:1143 start_codon:yes stop_codon:yes gene_type:complete
MKVLFIVQGEGRGHMTQALALEKILSNANHQVTAIAVGTSNRRSIPKFVAQNTNANLKTFKSPNFYFDKNSKSVNLWKTVTFNLLSTPLFLRELIRLHKFRKEFKPDLIVNFYDILGGLYFGLFRPTTQRVCIAHQYLALHNSFPFAEGFKTQKWAFRLNNQLTAIGSHKIIALSFRPLKSDSPKLIIAPPLLRKEVFSLTPTNGDYILAYVVNKGYAQEIIEWHKENKKIKIHCFWDNKQLPDEWKPHKNLTFHYINDQKFLHLMAGCAGYASTAGFESICEAMYLNKPVLMVPVKGQYEQACNAQDAKLARAGLSSTTFNIGLLLKHITKGHSPGPTFSNWLNGHEEKFLRALETTKTETKRLPTWESYKGVPRWSNE